MDVFVGIDVSKDRLDICVRPCGETFVVTRDDQDLERVVERLRALHPILVALEATGGNKTAVAGALRRASSPRPEHRGAIARRKGGRLSTPIAHFAEAVRPPGPARR
jgi:transposase